MASMCRFHRFEQSLPQGSFPNVSNRLVGECHCRPSLNKLFGCLPRVPSDTFSFEGSREDIFCHFYWKLPLQVMPFSLKNARSTYQRMMTRMFKPQLGRNIEIYIDDIVVKSKLEFEFVRDLGNIFEILRKHKLHFNASKCSFGVGLGKFLGYMVTHCGIEVNPDQIKAINNL